MELTVKAIKWGLLSPLYRVKSGPMDLRALICQGEY